MHSNGRGEETPEAYRGVVLPAGRQQPPAPYGEHVQPSGGTPWGEPAPGPEPADATQMLPPYPGAMPPPAVPVADATQMLPPYPGGDPGAATSAAGPGPVPPLPPLPPQQPVQPPQTPQPPAADDTQALPLSIFDEPQQHEPQQYEQQPYEQQSQQPYGQSYEQPLTSFGQQSFEQPQQQGQPQQPQQQNQAQPFGGQYGQQQSYEQPQQYGRPPYEEPQPGPEHDSDYDHLFRSDVPSPAPIRPRIIQPPSQQQPPPQYGQQPPQQYDPGYGHDGGDGGGRRRMSPAVVIGIAVAGCVIVGLVVGGLMSGGGGGKPDNTAAKSSATPASTAPSTSGSGSGDPAADSAVKQQAEALDALLKTSGSSRSSVVNAVESIKNCKDLGNASSDLRSAANQRNGLVTQLGGLAVDKLPDHADLTDALTKAWQASAAADGHYASWGDQAAHNHSVCKGGHARSTSEAQAANRESGTATEQKKRAVRLWNAIAEQYGLTQRQYSQL